MSKLDDHIRDVINDRVNDLERLFLASTEATDTGHQMEDCCNEVLREIREIKSETERIEKELNDIPRDGATEDDIRKILKEIPRDDNPTGDYPPLDDMLDETGAPHSFKDFLDILGAILGGAIQVVDWPAFLRWLFKLLPYLLLSGKAFIPLLSLVVGLWRGIQDAIDDAAARTDRRIILSDLDKLKQRMDDMAKLLAEIATGMQPGTETSMLLDRLQDIKDALDRYYTDIDDRLTAISNHLSTMEESIRGDIALIKSDDVMIRSDLACLSMWLKGDRSCDDYTIDVFTIAEQLQSTIQTIHCNLDEYYQSLATSLINCCTSMSAKFDQLKEEIDECKRFMTGPGNPFDSIQGDLDHGNVVGTGSLVLNYSNDLNAIKAMLTDIRRLL